MASNAYALAPAYTPVAWHSFYAVTGTAAATLTGLFFIAFSLRVQDLQHSLFLRTRARYLLLGLIVAFLGSAIVLIPDQPLAALSAEILTVISGYVIYTVVSVAVAARSEPFPLTPDLVARYVGMAVSLVLAYAAAISLVLRAGGGLYLLASAVLLALAVEVVSAWSFISGIPSSAEPGGEDAELHEQSANR